MTTAYIGLGSNVGDRLANLAAAVQALSELPETHFERLSHAYESEPAYVTDQPKFANAVAEITTGLAAEQLLEYLIQIEDDLGRDRTQEKGPRAIDLDILLFGDEEIATPSLVVPHPGLREREFVVVPLLDLAPRLHLPDGELLTREDATVGDIVGDLGPVPDLGASSNEPVFAADWAVVASCQAGQDIVTGWDAAISFQRQVLQDAGIPYAFDPYPPDEAMDPFGMPIAFRLLVPAEYEDRANKLLAQVLEAQPQFPEELEADA